MNLEQQMLQQLIPQIETMAMNMGKMRKALKIALKDIKNLQEEIEMVNMKLEFKEQKDG